MTHRLFPGGARVLIVGLFTLGLDPGPGVAAAEATSDATRFSVAHMDASVDPSVDFYRYACGTWLRRNPVPEDKSRWGGFDQLQQRNWGLVRAILEESAAAAAAGKARGGWRQVGDLYRSAMDTNRIERLGFEPIRQDLRRIARIRDLKGLMRLVAGLHRRDGRALFSPSVPPDEHESSVYVFRIGQGGLGLPDRDYYLAEGFAKQREAYRAYVTRMFELLDGPGESPGRSAEIVLDLETVLARASTARVDLRDPHRNYHRMTRAGLGSLSPDVPWQVYLDGMGAGRVDHLVIGQTNFVAALGRLLGSRPIAEWKTYLRWHVLNGAAPLLHSVAESEHFRFYGTTLRGQPQPEPRWQRAARLIDGSLGEALGSIYVERHFPPQARARMQALVGDLKAVFRERLEHLEWMGGETRARALAKFERFTQKIGHPERFRDYSAVVIREGELFGSLARAARVENERQLRRVGGAVDRTEWMMTPQTVNAYFEPSKNEIVFPAGILQPPFFDLDADDAVNYGAIGVVIGHEISHGYDDEGRKYDANGNLQDWWTPADAHEFEGRAQKLVEQYGGYEILPGVRVNGRLTLGENIADLGGITIAYEALQRSLARDPSKRRVLDGFTPEQRFFLSLAQLWRTNAREAELRRRAVVDPHSPGAIRAVGSHVNFDPFYAAFPIRPGTPMWLAPESRARIW